MKKTMKKLTSMTKMPFYNHTYVGNVFLGTMCDGTFGKVEFTKSSYYDSYSGIKLSLFTTERIIDETEMTFEDILSFKAEFGNEKGSPSWEWKSNDNSMNADIIEEMVSEEIEHYFDFFVKRINGTS